jgi:N-acetylglutamate synthase-like GNAT family acetyltransferase
VSTNYVGTSVSIREARRDEARALTELAIRSKASWGYDAAFMARARDDMRVSEHDLRHSYTLVAEDGGVLCGYAMTFLQGESAVLRDLFIEPTHFRRGLGTELFARALEYARANNAQRLVLHADPNARGFYEHLGMRCTREVKSNVMRGRMLPVMEIRLT